MTPSALPNGREILPGIVRSAAVEGCDLRAFRTVVDLRNDAGPGCTHHHPLERGLEGHPDFERLMAETWLATPAYYAAFCQLWPDRVAAAVHAIETLPRPLLFHCKAGWDRTGMIAAILLTRAGVGADAVVHDYALSRVGRSAKELTLRDSVGPWEAPLRAWLASGWWGFRAGVQEPRGVETSPSG